MAYGNVGIGRSHVHHSLSLSCCYSRRTHGSLMMHPPAPWTAHHGVRPRMTTRVSSRVPSGGPYCIVLGMVVPDISMTSTHCHRVIHPCMVVTDAHHSWVVLHVHRRLWHHHPMLPAMHVGDSHGPYHQWVLLHVRTHPWTCGGHDVWGATGHIRLGVAHTHVEMGVVHLLIVVH